MPEICNKKVLKDSIRQNALIRRSKCRMKNPEQYDRIYSRLLLSILIPLYDESNRTPVIGGYYAIGSELNCIPLLEKLYAADYTTCLPVVLEDQPLNKSPLEFREWIPGSETELGKHNIKIPVKTDLSEPIAPDVLLVPLVAYDDAGRRLGYGGGYYDRAIAVSRETQSRIVIIGLGFEAQLRNDLIHVHQAHDQLLDAIITDTNSVHIFSRWLKDLLN